MSNAHSRHACCRAVSSRRSELKRPSPSAIFSAVVSVRLVDVISGLRILNGLGGKDAHLRRYAAESAALRNQGYRVGGPAVIGALVSNE